MSEILDTGQNNLILVFWADIGSVSDIIGLGHS